jgi:phosphosulfolactate phosphohydrolase-like enzyme
VARFVPRWEVADVGGAVVVVDVLRAFTTAAYAFAAGAAEIWLVAVRP